ncbi:hypothetical protein DV735_g653, partial [Chaetothyriales sp. CBS 134920]
MSTTRATTKNVRVRKLNVKANIQIVREDQVDSLIDLDQERGPADFGVEKSEENEYHLQQAIRASQAQKQDAKLQDAYIPTPPSIVSDIKYDALYPKGFQQPATYIRSSATVEDCAGIPYCMDEEDELALKLINKDLANGHPPVTEDQFEEVMNFLEDTSATRQPFAAVDSAPVLPLEELQEHIDDSHPDFIRPLSKLIYEHWAVRRSRNGHRSLPPHLKFETGQESDDSDPYVCFRRRELRQIRKTRNRDAQSAEKLRRLRLELETARNLLLMVKRREQIRKEVIEIDRQVFEQRLAFRETKRKLNIKGDEELLVNVKKQKLPQGMSPNQAALAQQLRMPLAGATGPGADLRTLEDVQNERTRVINNEIQLNVDKHIRWNEGFVDKTKAPLTPDSPTGFDPQSGQFREAMPATYLPTPPASHSDEEGIEPTSAESEMKDVSRASTPFRYASPVDDDDTPMPAFRRRLGRGGRMMIDRKFNLHRERHEVDDEDDRWKYDSDDNDASYDDGADSGDAFVDRTSARMVSRAFLIGSSRPPESASSAALLAAQRKAQIESSSSSPTTATTSSAPIQGA